MTPSVEQARLALDVLRLPDPQSTGCRDEARLVLKGALTDPTFGHPRAHGPLEANVSAPPTAPLTRKLHR